MSLLSRSPNIQAGNDLEDGRNSTGPLTGPESPELAQIDAQNTNGGDPDLTHLINVWQTLPETVKVGIMVMAYGKKTRPNILTEKTRVLKLGKLYNLN